MSLSSTWFMSNQYFIPHRLMLLARMIDRETARDLHRDFNITAAEWRALGYICTMGSSSAAQICVAFEVDRAEVSRAVARLLDAELIQRGQARDRENRLVLTPTPRGEELHDRCTAGEKLRAVAPYAVGSVGERDPFRIAAVPCVLGGADLMNCTIERKRRNRRSIFAHAFSPILAGVGIVCGRNLGMPRGRRPAAIAVQEQFLRPTLADLI